MSPAIRLWPWMRRRRGARRLKTCPFICSPGLLAFTRAVRLPQIAYLSHIPQFQIGTHHRVFGKLDRAGGVLAHVPAGGEVRAG